MSWSKFLTAAAVSTAFTLGITVPGSADDDRDCPPGQNGNYCQYGERDDDFARGDRDCARRTIRGTSGDDTLTGTRRKETILGRGGNDTIDGGRGADCLFGGSGDDAITGGGGRDRIRAGSGDDAVSARDGRRDRIRCGRGNDTVVADGEDRVHRDCETVDRD